MVYKIADLGVSFVQTDSRGDTDYVDGCNAAEAVIGFCCLNNRVRPEAGIRNDCFWLFPE